MSLLAYPIDPTSTLSELKSSVFMLLALCRAHPRSVRWRDVCEVGLAVLGEDDRDTLIVDFEREILTPGGENLLQLARMLKP